jgi:hypothetical protein
MCERDACNTARNAAVPALRELCCACLRRTHTLAACAAVVAASTPLAYATKNCNVGVLRALLTVVQRLNLPNVSYK